MKHALIAGLGGFIGSSLRYIVAVLAYKHIGQSFPFGTLIVNLMGSFLIGMLMAVFEERFVFSSELRTFLIIGILGGFTTFSSFSYETLVLLREGSYWIGFQNVVFTFLGCFLATAAGIIIGKLL